MKSRISPELVARVIEAPDDDAPRLVIADALQTQNDPRGEFIVVQCALAREPLTKKRMTKTKRAELEKIQKKLLEQHGHAWQGEVGLGDARCEFRRGFIEVVHLRRPLREEITDLAWSMSPIRELAMHAHENFVALLDHPSLPRIDTLALSQCNVTPTLLARVPTSTIREITFWNDSPTDTEKIDVLSKWTALTTLAVTATREQLGAGCTEAITKCDALTSRLVHLRIGEQASDSRSAHDIAGARWKALVGLAVVQARVDDAGVAALASAPAFGSKLETLKLAINGIGDAGAKALATSSSLTKLRALDLSFNDVRGAGALAFADKNNLPALEDLDLRYNHHVGDEASAKLTQRLGKRFVRY